MKVVSKSDIWVKFMVGVLDAKDVAETKLITRRYYSGERAVQRLRNLAAFTSVTDETGEIPQRLTQAANELEEKL